MFILDQIYRAQSSKVLIFDSWSGAVSNFITPIIFEIYLISPQKVRKKTNKKQIYVGGDSSKVTKNDVCAKVRKVNPLEQHVK